MDLSQIKAVVFDLEGTLLDRTKSRDKFYRKNNMNVFMIIILYMYNLLTLNINL